MAEYAISGVWKDESGTITHYALHTKDGNDLGMATKITKVRAVQLLGAPGNSGITVIWNYTRENWQWGEAVHVVLLKNLRYLRTNHDNNVRDNLGHLINYSLIATNFTV